MKELALLTFWIITMPVNGHKSLFILGLEDLDRRVNASCAGILNRTLIENGYQFGDPRESISSVIGKNEVDGTLTKTGKAIDSFLNLFQKDHCIINIQNF